MTMSREEKLAYSRGYNAGIRWPAHRPPMPPEPQSRLALETLRKLRDAVDAELATFDQEDELVKSLSPLLDEADGVFEQLTVWLKGK